MGTRTDASTDHWRGHLRLDFNGTDGKTRILHKQHVGPLLIQKPFYPEGDVCHAYIIHPPGGVVGGDQLGMDIRVENNGHALVTTPAAGKFYRSDGRTAMLQQTLSVASGAVLEWLPQETILFSACQVAMTTRVRLQPGAGFCGWEILCLGRPACGESFAAGQVNQAFEIWRDQGPVFLDRSRYLGGDVSLTAKWGLQGYSVSGTLVVVNATPECLQSAREIILPADKGLLSATLMDDILVCRGLAHQGESLRKAFIEIWRGIRPLLYAREACSPRIWAT